MVDDLGKGVRLAVRKARARIRQSRRRGAPMSALIVEVPEVDRLLGEWRRRLDPSAAQGMPAHVTLLYPFLERDRIEVAAEQTLSQELSTSTPWDFALTELRRFPGVAYLAPEPAEPFILLTQRLLRLWPKCLPYDGAFAEVVPHVTLAVGPEPDGLAGAVEHHLPISARVGDVLLMTESDDGNWSLRRRFALSG